MATQFVTYHLSSYSQVIDKSKAIQAVEGEVVIVKAKSESFDDHGKENNNYILVAKLPIEQVSLDTGLELKLIRCIETADYLRIKPLDYAHIVQTLYTYYHCRRLGKCAGSCAASDTCPKNDLYTIQEPIGTSA